MLLLRQCLTARDVSSGNVVVRKQTFNLSSQRAHEACVRNKLDDPIDKVTQDQETVDDVNLLKIDKPCLEAIGSTAQTEYPLDNRLGFDKCKAESHLSSFAKTSPFHLPKEKTNEYNESGALKFHRSHIHEEVENVCPICLEQYGEGDVIIASKHCSHVFHKSCIFTWLEQHEECPCCREMMMTIKDITSLSHRNS